MTNIWSDQNERLEEIPKIYQNFYKQALKGKSRRSAIKIHCLMCVGYDREEVKKCTAPACPLYLYRIKG